MSDSTREWKKADAVRLRAYDSGAQSLLLQLRADAPKRLTLDELLKLPGESVARQQLLLEGYEMALKNIEGYREDPVEMDDASQ